MPTIKNLVTATLGHATLYPTTNTIDAKQKQKLALRILEVQLSEVGLKMYKKACYEMRI
jgi:hypothetical protein